MHILQPRARRAPRHPPTDLYSQIVVGVLASPCFPNFQARTTFVLETLPEAKIPAQDAFFGGHRRKTNRYPVRWIHVGQLWQQSPLYPSNFVVNLT